MRFDRPPHSRHNSDQDVIIPSVESEAVSTASPRHVGSTQSQFRVPEGYAQMQSPKRKSFPGFQNGRDVCPEQDVRRVKPVYLSDEVPQRSYAHQSDSSQSMDIRGRPRMPSPPPVIDLTTSPYRGPTGNARGHFVPVRSFPAFEARDRIYVSQPSHHLPLRDVRGAYYEPPAAEPSHGYISDHRSYERRAPPAREYVPPRYEGQRPHFEEGPR